MRSLAALLLVLLFGVDVIGQTSQPIDRRAVVTRHNVTMTGFDPLSPLSVGNGEFAFTVDPTGLQTFPELYEKFTPLCTQAQWGWHTIPMPQELKGQQFRYAEYDTYGRKVTYNTSRTGQEQLFNYLRENPHKFHLGRIALDLRKADGSPATPDDLTNIRQTLDLWTGIITSTFDFDGQPVKVTTACAGDLDAIAVRVESTHDLRQRVRVVIAYPYGASDRDGADWTKPEAHHTTIEVQPVVAIRRRMDGTNYTCLLALGRDTGIAADGAHRALLRSSGRVLEFTCRFTGEQTTDAAPAPEAALDASRGFWRDFWSTGGAIDLSDSTDSRWRELERRIVLSQYLTRVNCAGSLPPQETGLVCNSWFGKFHLEMHWWHDVHFAIWDRIALMKRAMGYYQRILPQAREIARRQGYKGARWPKMTDASGIDSPSPIGPLLIWQQPHPIYYAELCYRAQPDRKTLEQWQQVVEESADFMASYAVRDPKSGRYVLGPPLKTVSEHTEAREAINPAFELSYWRFGLRVAQEWRQRMGLPRKPEWDEVLNNLAPLPQHEGLYLTQEGHLDTWTEWNWEHPSLIGSPGMLPGDGTDPAVARRTIEKVMQVWQWDRCWGWDFPMAAMSAARNGRPDLAIDALMIESIKNKHLPNGHVYQRENLTLYLPANGGLLTAVGMMAAGWDGAPEGINAPGFPKDGKWVVRWEGLKRLP